LTEHILVLNSQKGWLAVDKPCGISVHNDPGKDIVSFVRAKIQSDLSLAKRLGAEPGFKVQPVHRLDKETSGVLLLATDHGIVKHLSELFAKGEVKKQYLALVHGNFNLASGHDEYHWVFPLSKKAGGRNNPTGQGKLVNCKTEYKVLEQSLHYSLLEIKLLTGRKHQIRRHAKLAKHPVTGDMRYGSTKSINYLKNMGYHRMGLHCSQLEFILPGKNKTVCIQSQNRLEEIHNLLAKDIATNHSG